MHETVTMRDAISPEQNVEREGKYPMEAYMLDLDLRTATQAIANRSAADFDPFGSWLLQTGGGGKVAEEWLKHWPSHAVADLRFGAPTDCILMIATWSTGPFAQPFANASRCLTSSASRLS